MTTQSTIQELKALNDEITTEIDAELFTPTIVAEDVNSLDDLDALLSESLSLRNERGAGKGLREQLAKAQTSEEALEIEATLRAWEARHEWETIANCALFHEQICSCGAVHTHFAGMYYHQKHRSDKHAQRWIAAVQNLRGVNELAVSALVPNRTMKETRYTPVCVECADRMGFDLDKAEEPWK